VPEERLRITPKNREEKMFKDIPFSRWVVCLSFVICLAIPQNGSSIQILKLMGEEYYCEKVKKGKCYPCGDKKGISVGEGKLINKPDKSCSDFGILILGSPKEDNTSKEIKAKSVKTPTTFNTRSDSRDTGTQMPQNPIPPTTPDPGSNSTIKNLNKDY
jgi:hypothetical protein